MSMRFQFRSFNDDGYLPGSQPSFSSSFIFPGAYKAATRRFVMSPTFLVPLSYDLSS